MPIIETRGSLSSRGYGQFAQSAAPAPAAAYIEDVFSTWLYPGIGSTQTITNGIDLATKGGLVWIKSRSDTNAHGLWDTSRGAGTSSTDNKALSSNLTNAQGLGALTHFVSSFNSTGFGVNVGASAAVGFRMANQNGVNYASWTFAKQPKFFDVVTYTGNGASSQIVSHSLGVAPACIIIKKTSAAQNWRVYTRRNDTVWTSLYLNLTNAGADFNYSSISPALTSTTIDFGYISSYIEGGNNDNGATYVAYLFAHNAGGFGASGTDNVISCGSFTTDDFGNATVNLGYEPQWLLTKQTNAANSWYLEDTMRGMSLTSYSLLVPNTSAAEANAAIPLSSPTATGFTAANQNPSSTFIYIAIRRGPMRTPTSGTSVFAPLAYTGNGTSGTFRATGFVTDMVWSQSRQGIMYSADYDRLRGASQVLLLSQTDAEVAQSAGSVGVSGFNTMTGYIAGADQSYGAINFGSSTYANWCFRRAPGFFDEVCYTGVASGTLTINHNLGVTPELIITKARTGTLAPGWFVGSNYLTNGYSTAGHILQLQSTAASVEQGYFRSANATTATLDNVLARSGQTYVAYLFASCPGVSKVGTYTGTGSTVQVNCGFTAGARFVLIKRTDAAGNWYIWDSARGIVAANDPYLQLNVIDAEVTNTDWVDTLATGFEVSNAGSNLVNVSGGTYLFLAIA